MQRADVKAADSLTHSGRPILRQAQEKVGGAEYASTERLVLIAVEVDVTQLYESLRTV